MLSCTAITTEWSWGTWSYAGSSSPTNTGKTWTQNAWKISLVWTSFLWRARYLKEETLGQSKTFGRSSCHTQAYYTNALPVKPTTLGTFLVVVEWPQRTNLVISSLLQNSSVRAWPWRLCALTWWRRLSDRQTWLSCLCGTRTAVCREQVIFRPGCRHLEPGCVSVHHADWTIPISGHAACSSICQNPPRYLQPSWWAVTTGQVSD